MADTAPAPTCTGDQDCAVPDHATLLTADGVFHGGPVEAMTAALTARATVRS